MSQELSDDELRVLMRALSRAAGMPLSDERIEVVLPAYRGFLGNVRAMDEVELPVEVEPAVSFNLSRELL